MMKYLFAAICAVVLLISCNGDNDNISQDIKEPAIFPKAKRTVIVYISAENNLSSFATGDINEMIKGSENLPDDVNLIAFVDKRESVPPYILRIQKGQKQMDTYYENTEDFYASDPERMYETMHWIMTRYPAETYGLVLWGHASGWVIENDSVANTSAHNKPQRAYGVDYGTDMTDGKGSKWMNIPSMAKALERLHQKMLFIFADCCNFQCAEVAYELRNATDYIIASPAEIPNAGAPYDKIVPHMFSMDNNFYEKIVDDYHNVITNGTEQVPLSVVKTNEMENLATATREVTALLVENGEPDTDRMIYYRLTKQYGNIKVMFDMNDMMLRNITNSTAYKKWKQAYDKAVVYRAMSGTWMTNGLLRFDFDMTEERFGGMSMFVPLSVYDANGYNLNKTILQMAWYYAAGVYNCYTDGIKN